MLVLWYLMTASVKGARVERCAVRTCCWFCALLNGGRTGFIAML